MFKVKQCCYLGRDNIILKTLIKLIISDFKYHVTSSTAALTVQLAEFSTLC